MKIEQYENIDGVPMILLLDEENNTAKSMTKEYYDTLASESANDPAGNL